MAWFRTYLSSLSAFQLLEQGLNERLVMLRSYEVSSRTARPGVLRSRDQEQTGCGRIIPISWLDYSPDLEDMNS